MNNNNYNNNSNYNNNNINKVNKIKVSCFTPSLCIPRLFNNVTEEIIRITINNLKLGVIHKIDLKSVTNKNGDCFKRAFIHFKKWNEDERTNIIREKLIAGNEIKIIYDDPWFWKISAFRKPIPLYNQTNPLYNQTNPLYNQTNTYNPNNKKQIEEIKLPKSPPTTPPITARKIFF